MRATIDHPLRSALHGEVHARPFTPIFPPERVSHVAMLSGEEGAAEDRAHLSRLCQRFGVPVPGDGSYLYHDFGPFRLKWERHTEFSTYTFFHHGRFAAPFEEPAVAMVPEDWLEGLPGQRLVAVHVAVEPADAPAREPVDVARLIGSENLVGSTISAGAQAWTDFHLYGDGFGRILVRDCGLTPHQAGRLVQRLLEIETYRMMALLSYPLARETGPEIRRIDRALAEIMEGMGDISSVEDERDLLLQLTGLAAESERIAARTSYRFGAGFAYYALVVKRIEELREERVEGLQTFSEFMERRLAPAMRTCESVAARQDALSQRVVRASNLLRTGVDIALEEQNRDLLASMDRRARVQLRLQQTVEGLSVAAISYYVVSLLGYGFDAGRAAGLAFDVDMARGLSIPVVILLAWYGVRRLRRALMKVSDGDGAADG